MSDRSPSDDRPAVTIDPDQRLREMLEALEIPYEVDEDGDFEVGVRLDPHTQRVWISGTICTVHKAEVRDVFAYGCMVPEGSTLPPQLCLELLARRHAIGAWVTLGERAACFTASLDVAASPELLESTLLAVAETSLQLRLELAELTESN